MKSVCCVEVVQIDTESLGAYEITFKLIYLLVLLTFVHIHHLYDLYNVFISIFGHS